MTEVKAVRAALERLRDSDTPVWPNRPVERALVSEGLAACDGFEITRESMDYASADYPATRLDLIASILKKAGLL